MAKPLVAVLIDVDVNVKVRGEAGLWRVDLLALFTWFFCLADFFSLV